MDCAAFPSAVPALISSRSISPVEIAGMPNQFEILPDCVPLPLPGGPKSRRTKPSSVSVQTANPSDSVKLIDHATKIR
jgi:hypothetical protein